MLSISTSIQVVCWTLFGITSGVANTRVNHPTVHAASAQQGFEPPLFNITATSLYDAGRQHGVLASDRIRKWFDSEELRDLATFVKQSAGRKAFERLRNASSNAFPLYADELRGIADGANIALDTLWTGILMIELENLNGEVRDHCSDISAISHEGYRHGFAHGHNEDWSAEVGALYYYVKYTAAPGADFESCAGLAYPGALIGWAPTWNAHGMFFSVNTLVPQSINAFGISTSFIQRDAICGIGKGQTMASVIHGLKNPGWADGASVNVVDTANKCMANVEIYESKSNVSVVSESMGNNSHFNSYKRIVVKQDPFLSSIVRQRRVDLLPPPRSVSDIASILSNTADGPLNSLLRNITIATLLVDGVSGLLEAWGGLASESTPAIHSWNLTTFFD
eukprot:m.99711 g.99711  ORF g.99711 m.99711 type:complete len:395 (-) comp27181_c0_seq2:117-1301(-)